MGVVDSAFVQSIEHRPNPTGVVEADGIPTVDLSSSEGRVAAAVGEACRDWGFFQVINHGVPPGVRGRVEAAAREFFGRAAAEKREVRRSEGNPVGYYDEEHTKNVRDWKEVFDFSTAKDTPSVIPASLADDDGPAVIELVNQWPRYPPQFREACEEYAVQMEKLAFRLLEFISLSLGMPANRLNGHFSPDHTSFIRLNHYPPCPDPHLALGVGRHKDAGALTVLAQDHVGGLQVKRKTDGHWVRVEPNPNAYIINVGDIFQVWSNDRYESVEHRVMVNVEKERLSMPFFFNPAHDTTVEPLAELTGDRETPKYRPYNWGKFFAKRKFSNFKKLDVDNIQIAHLRL